jgi:glutamine amidotransferase
MRDGSVAIVDFGMGNLFSVKQACAQAGLRASVTSDKEDILAASAVILPGMGAFGVAMERLAKLDLVDPLRDLAASGTPLAGICLGMQLLLSQSQEFGRHRGLGIVEGDVVRLENSVSGTRSLKVPQVGWNRIHAASPWTGTILEGVEDGNYMYFVHSFYCRVADASVVLSTTGYGPTDFCSTLQRGNVFACQFHPERSGRQGLRLYKNLADLVNRSIREGA